MDTSPIVFIGGGNMASAIVAGLVKGASAGEGLGNKFLSHIREVDALIQVVRCFEDPDIHHVTGSIDPKFAALELETS